MGGSSEQKELMENLMTDVKGLLESLFKSYRNKPKS